MKIHVVALLATFISGRTSNAASIVGVDKGSLKQSNEELGGLQQTRSREAKLKDIEDRVEKLKQIARTVESEEKTLELELKSLLAEVAPSNKVVNAAKRALNGVSTKERNLQMSVGETKTKTASTGKVEVKTSPVSPDLNKIEEEKASLSETFASCILVMDDNHRLIEWLAYHYHTMPLRRLIVTTDPRSKTSPLPVLNRWGKYMKIDLWSDDDLFTKEELKNRTDADMVKIHRSRQRAFNIKCLTTLRDEGAKWTLMTDVDEFLRINPRVWDSSEHLYQKDIAPIQLNEPGSVLQMLNKVDLNDERLHAQEWKACLPVSRVQLSGTESTDEEVNNFFPKAFAPTILAKDFDTFRWRYSGVDTITAKDGVIPGKTLIDVSSIPESEMWRLIGDPHRPIDKLCNGGNVWLNATETMFVADHIVGTLESFAARDDSRFIDRVVTWEQRKTLGAGLKNLHDELRPWLSGFAETLGIGESRRLLANVGQLQTLTHDLPRCSINFFGLPRSFKTMALPSIVKNVLVPNARYNCDIVVHYYNIQFEKPSRFNRGGELDADAVYALEEVSKVIAANAGKSPPSVIIKGETKEEFEKKYGDLIKGYKTTKDGNTGELKYFPWKDKSYSETGKQIDNIVMQWNSIQSAWEFMEEYRKMHGFEYERVAFIRTDAFYALPVDIFQVDKDTFDYNNRYAVIPAFARYPVNDRMMYGPYEAVKIWATERFQRIEHYIDSCETKGYGMHQERYIGNGILPAIREETGYEIVENADICFYRTRAADNVLITDCSDPRGGVVRGIQEIDQVKLIQDLVHRDCLEVPLDPLGRFIELRCDESSMKEVSARKLESGTSPNNAPTANPTPAPTPFPTLRPISEPSDNPSEVPSDELPSVNPSGHPTTSPSSEPSKLPSLTPSLVPSTVPSVNPSLKPSVNPSQSPSSSPSSHPSTTPSTNPTSLPSINPSGHPTTSPSSEPSKLPSLTPSLVPSTVPSVNPSLKSSVNPSQSLSLPPSSHPSTSPSLKLSSLPSLLPSLSPSLKPSPLPSLLPSLKLSLSPSSGPSAISSPGPTIDPASPPRPSSEPSLSVIPTFVPSVTHSLEPSFNPSVYPSLNPSFTPSVYPSLNPSFTPSLFHSPNPSIRPEDLEMHVSQKTTIILPLEANLLSKISSNRKAFDEIVQIIEETVMNITEAEFVAVETINGIETGNALPDQGGKRLFMDLNSLDTVVIGGKTYVDSEFGTNVRQVIECDKSDCPDDTESINAVVEEQQKKLIESIENGNFSKVANKIAASLENNKNGNGLLDEDGFKAVMEVEPPESFIPSIEPSAGPSPSPSSKPTLMPSDTPSYSSSKPSERPSVNPSSHPSNNPSRQPSLQPSVLPTIHPSVQPTNNPSSLPSINHSGLSTAPSVNPSLKHSVNPSQSPSSSPSSHPNYAPTANPTPAPTPFPTLRPISEPSGNPSEVFIEGGVVTTPAKAGFDGVSLADLKDEKVNEDFDNAVTTAMKKLSGADVVTVTGKSDGATRGYGKKSLVVDLNLLTFFTCDGECNDETVADAVAKAKQTTDDLAAVSSGDLMTEIKAADSNLDILEEVTAAPMVFKEPVTEINEPDTDDEAEEDGFVIAVIYAILDFILGILDFFWFFN